MKKNQLGQSFQQMQWMVFEPIDYVSVHFVHFICNLIWVVSSLNPDVMFSYYQLRPTITNTIIDLARPVYLYAISAFYPVLILLLMYSTDDEGEDEQVPLTARDVVPLKVLRKEMFTRQVFIIKRFLRI